MPDRFFFIKFEPVMETIFLNKSLKFLFKAANFGLDANS